MLSFLKNIEFANPDYFYLLFILPFIIVWYIFKSSKSYPVIKFPTFAPFINYKKTARQRWHPILLTLRILTIIFLIITLARPQSKISRQNVTIEGIDIVIAYDISGSMLAEDLKPNRLEAARDVAINFINGRPNDRIGLVIFSGEAFTQCPLTTDHNVLKNLFLEIKSGIIEDGTAIGDGLATSISRIKDSKSISKVIILITDGINNMGSVDPLSAADIAKMYGIRVYTIGVGSTGYAPYPFKTRFGIQYQNVEVKIDEDLLRKISKSTDANYYRATSKNKLDNIFKEIDKLEKSKIDVTEFHKKNEEFLIFALLAALFLMLEIVLRYTIFRSLP